MFFFFIRKHTQLTHTILSRHTSSYYDILTHKHAMLRLALFLFTFYCIMTSYPNRPQPAAILPTNNNITTTAISFYSFAALTIDLSDDFSMLLVLWCVYSFYLFFFFVVFSLHCIYIANREGHIPISFKIIVLCNKTILLHDCCCCCCKKKVPKTFI